MNKILLTRSLILYMLAAFGLGHVVLADDGMEFDRTIAPILAHRCLTCHSGDDVKGKLDLSTRESAMAGGESGKVIEPGRLEDSLMWTYIESDEMPPKKPLTEEEKTRIKNWISQGARWGTERIDPFRYSTDNRAGLDWWSLQPLQTVEPPMVANAAWTASPIDAFVYDRLNQAGLEPNSPADRRTIIRRLSFDLLGLPPTPQQIDEYLADKSDNAYERLVDRMLESPHYGERWARHWLDIVRFGESNGFEYDEPRDNFWHYRNWVIDALNQDMPYTEFVRMQIAGDALRPADPAAMSAVGYLVAGPHNTTLPSNEKMQMSMAQDELEDLVGSVCQSFLGLTANCARCHDHKFDPISQKEYYQLAAALVGVKHGEREVRVPMTPALAQRICFIDARMETLRGEVESLEGPIRQHILAARRDGTPVDYDPPKATSAWEFDSDLNDSVGTLHATAHGNAQVRDGFLVLDGKESYVVTPPLATNVEEKTLEVWVQLDNLEQAGGGAITIQTMDGVTFDSIVFGEREPKRWMAGSNGFVRTMPFQGADENDAADRAVHFAIVYKKDGTIAGYRDGQPYGQAYRPGDVFQYAAGKAQFIFGMRHSPVGGNRMLAGRIQRAQFYDRALTPEEVAASAGVVDLNYVSPKDILAKLDRSQQELHQELSEEISRLESERKDIVTSESRKLYTCVSGNPGVTRLLRRGDVGSPAEEVLPTGLTAISSLNPDFGLAGHATDGERRAKLAEWITDEQNPLFARVMVNRLWHYHFGNGLVTTTSDFGFNGGRPSHPELMEWLAQKFKSVEYRLKPMHRLLVTSATYRQSSGVNTRAIQVDADNRLLWRMSPQRLNAEAIRDSVLVVTGKLNPTIGGRGYRDVEHRFFKGSHFYDSINESGPDAHRRTIYRFTPRGGRNPFLDTFDCPDPSATAPNRANTTTPLQALALLNNALIFEMSDDFAQSVLKQSAQSTPNQIELVYLRAYGRPPTDDEKATGVSFVEKHGLPMFCRAVLNTNEFLFIR
jgi:Protein of unknown function (DUF1553)/Protein of unknown function (DUF1549)/Planctomycete cytochrome C/Concanavalin A-like lectin/glucanases superfamily